MSRLEGKDTTENPRIDRVTSRVPARRNAILLNAFTPFGGPAITEASTKCIATLRTCRSLSQARFRVRPRTHSSTRNKRTVYDRKPMHKPAIGGPLVNRSQTRLSLA